MGEDARRTEGPRRERLSFVHRRRLRTARALAPSLALLAPVLLLSGCLTPVVLRHDVQGIGLYEVEVERLPGGATRLWLRGGGISRSCFGLHLGMQELSILRVPLDSSGHHVITEGFEAWTGTEAINLARESTW